MMGKAKSNDTDASSSTCSVNATSKWSVIDAPGVKQPDWTKEQREGNNTGEAAAKTKQQKDGLQGRRAKASTGPKIEGESGNLIGGDAFTKRTSNPEWLKSRESTYEKIKQRRQMELETKKQVPITVTLPDGKTLDQNKQGDKYMAWKTSPYDVAVTISQGLADSATVARVTYANYVEDYSPSEDGMEGEDMLMDAMADGGVEGDATQQDNAKNTLLWDLSRPLVGNVSKIEFLKFDNDRDAKTVFWHSSAHMMGEALEHLWGCKLTIGPPLAGGFYYDSYMGSGPNMETFREDDCT